MSDTSDSLFDDHDCEFDDVDISSLPIVYQSPPITIPGLYIHHELIPEEIQSEIISNLSFHPPDITQHVAFGKQPRYISNLDLYLENQLKGVINQTEHKKLFHQNLPRQSIVNVYGYDSSPRSYYLASHTDLAKFGEGVIIVSLGTSIGMKFESSTGESFEIFLKPGSILCMTDEARYNWTHGIVPRTVDRVDKVGLLKRGIRVGLTLRYYNQNIDNNDK